MIKIILLIYLLPLFSLANNSVKVNDNNKEKSKITLTVAIEAVDYFPYNYTEKGKIKGFSIDLLDYISENSKYDFKFITLPWARALYFLAEGKVDLVLTLFKNAKREKIYNFIEPFYGYEVNQLFTLKDKKVEFNGQLQQLTPYSIGLKSAYSYGENFDQAGYLTKVPALTEELLLKLLLAKRIDMVVANPFVFNLIISKMNVDAKIKAIKPYIALTPVYLGLTKAREDSEEITKTFGQLTEQLKASPYYQELLDKYQLNFN